MFGVEDSTCRVVGIDDETIFKTMDAITNAIADCCEPAIYPDVSLQTVEGKTIIVVEIPIGRQRPYYIKSMGKDDGVFVRYPELLPRKLHPRNGFLQVSFIPTVCRKKAGIISRTY